MFYRKKMVFLFLVFLIFPFQKVIADGSIYSMRARGPLLFYQGGRATGMGGATISVANSSNLNWLNPASLSVQDHVRISSQFLYNNFTIDDGTQQYKTGSANFNGFIAAFPIHSRMGMNLGLQPLSQVNYEFETLQTIDSYDYSTLLRRKGGLNKMFLSTGLRIGSRFHVGAGINYIFGRIEESRFIDFQNSNFQNTHDQINLKYSGLDVSTGFIVTPVSGWNIGGIYQTKYNLHKKLDTRYYEPNLFSNENIEEKSPSLWGAGTSVYIKRRLLIAMDYITQDWRTYSTGEENTQREFRQMKKFSVGLEYSTPYKMGISYWKILRYRLGFSWQQPYFSDFTDNNLTSYTLSTGIGLPFASGSGAIDIALEYSKRGSLPTNSFTESIFALSVYVSGGELWFQRRK